MASAIVDRFLEEASAALDRGDVDGAWSRLARLVQSYEPTTAKQAKQVQRLHARIGDVYLDAWEREIDGGDLEKANAAALAWTRHKLNTDSSAKQSARGEKLAAAQRELARRIRNGGAVVRAFAAGSPASAAELAERTGLDLRDVRERLHYWQSVGLASASRGGRWSPSSALLRSLGS